MNSSLPKRSQAKTILFGILAIGASAALILLTLEITVRFLVLRDTQYDWLEWHPTRLYINNPHLPDVYWDTEWNVNSLGLRGPEIGPKNQSRILCLGSSSTFGYRVDYEEAYPTQLDRLLEDFEVINGGTFGYSSYQGKVFFEEMCAFLKPDAVTLAFGYNDRRYVLRPEWRDGEENFKQLYRLYSWHDFWMNSRIYQWLMKKQFKEKTQHHPPVTSLIPRVNVDSFRENLASIIERCHEKNIQVVLIFLGEHPEQYHAVESGVEAMHEGEYENALEWFDRARRGKSEDARVMATYYKALTLITLGREAEADQIAYDYPFAFYFPGVNPIRTYHAYLNVLRQLSIEYDLPLVYFREVVNHDAAYYMDECHLTAEGYRILADELANSIP